MSTTKVTSQASRAGSMVPTASPEVDPLADIVTGTSDDSLTQRAPGGLRAPLWRLAVTSGFGARIHPVLGTRRFHRGVDYGARSGTHVRAAAAGTVVWASDLGPYGTLVVIEHEPDLHTAYGHLASTRVAIGQHVRTGQRIGRVGSTGLATGPHLHFEVRHNGTPSDPARWLELQLGALLATADALAAKCPHALGRRTGWDGPRRQLRSSSAMRRNCSTTSGVSWVGSSWR